MDECYWLPSPVKSTVTRGKSETSSVSSTSKKPRRKELKSSAAPQLSLKRKREPESSGSSSKKTSNLLKKRALDGEKQVNLSKPKMIGKKMKDVAENTQKSKKNKENTPPLNLAKPETVSAIQINQKDTEKKRTAKKEKENNKQKKNSTLSEQIMKKGSSVSNGDSNGVIYNDQSKSITSPCAEDLLQFKHDYWDPEWAGNEDDGGSVASGLLEEDYCWECGVSTMDSLQSNDVVLCDVCDGEYHLKCVGLDKVPRSTYVCTKCILEQESQNGLRFNVSETFKVN
jgi:hypothetical protein